MIKREIHKLEISELHGHEGSNSHGGNKEKNKEDNKEDKKEINNTENGGKTKLSKNIDDNISYIKKYLGMKKNFDVVLREMTVGDIRVGLLFINGLTNDRTITLILESLVEAKREDIIVNTFEKIFYRRLNYTQVTKAETLEKFVADVLVGQQGLLIDGQETGIIIDARAYPSRQPGEPDLEKVVRGSRDGFVETLVANTALIRRRIRDPKLRMEHMQAGDRSKSDIAICYIEGVAQDQLVEKMRNKIKNISIDGLPMAEKAVEELITPGSYWNPFPRVRYTERPDVAAAHLLEGHVMVLVDTSPSAIIAPATFWHHLQHAEEYRENPTVGVYLRWVRFFGVAVSIFLLPLWLLAVLNPSILPPRLEFIGLKDPATVPVVLQILLAEIAIDMVRMATIHTPTALATATGLIAALLIGQIATTVGLFSPEVIMYVAAVAVGSFMTPSFELAMANRLARLFLIAMVAAFLLPGFVVGTLIVLALLITSKSFDVPYMWPLIPLNWKALKNVLIRTPVPMTNFRPSIVTGNKSIRQAVPEPARKPENKK